MKSADAVKLAQAAMNEWGETLTVDGVPGPKTTAAMEKFDFFVTAQARKVEVPADGKITTGQDPDEGTEPWYRRMFNACLVDEGREAMLASAVRTINGGMGRYLTVANRLRAQNPELFAVILGIIHFKEASCDFRGVLHNGEKIVGTGKKTTIVPKGRGPFASWEDSAVDAIGEHGRWEKLLSNGSNDVGPILYAMERFNGTGYITGAGKAETSPYLWACSNVNDNFGKYVSDGKFSSTASTQSTPGGALLLKEFAKAGTVKVVS